MQTRLIRNCLFALLVAALPAVALQQRAAADDDPPGRVARLNYLEGSVSFQPAGETDWVSAVINRPVTTGDRLWADNGARAELHLGSAAIRLGSNSGFSFLNLDDRTIQIQLTQGTLNIRVRRLGRDENFEVDTPNQAFSILRPGLYRVQSSEDGNSTNVTVRSGEGEATGAGQTYRVEAGQIASFTGTDSLNANIVDAGGLDDFDNWSRGRDRRDDGSRSARYVSPNVVGYEDLDENGSWRTDSNYGDVWVPRAVPVGWAPYHNGHWAWISPWGWTWVDDEPWGYAPFHYGRWVFVGENWCWVPGPIAVEPVYAPALVAFIGGPHFGVAVSIGGGGYDENVGWFPLGPREVYVPSYNVSREYVNRVNVSNTTVNTTTITNVYNTQVTNNINNSNTTKITYINKTVPGAVTAVPQKVFASAQPVAKAAVAVNPQQAASASVSSRAAVAPTRNSVLGASASTGSKVPQPPAAVANRSVVAKAPPPPPPVPFATQQQALAAHPGQPLAKNEVESLRPASVPAAQPHVKQAPPGKPATPNANHTVGQPTTGQPANAQPNTPAKPSNPPPPAANGNAPANNPPPLRNDRPPSSQPSNRPSNGPGNKPSNPPPPAAGGNAPANNPPPLRNDRPPSSQPSNRPSNEPGNKPSNPPPPAAGGNAPANNPPPLRNDRPPSSQPSNRPSNEPGNKPSNPPPPAAGGNAPANNPPPLRNDRPPSSQPSNRPSNEPGNRPSNPPPPAAGGNAPANNPPPLRNDRPPSSQPSNRPSNEPGNKPFNPPPPAAGGNAPAKHPQPPPENQPRSPEDKKKNQTDQNR